MWPHNSFGITGPFPSGFNQEDFLYPPNTFQNTTGPLEQHSSGLQPDNLAEINTANGQKYNGYVKNGFRSEPEVINQAKPGLNPPGLSPIVQGVPRPLSTTQASNPRPSAPQISSRAAELKAQLLARRANPSSSPSSNSNPKSDTNVNTNGTKQDKPQAPSLLNKSPIAPSSSENQEQPLNLSDLILQYSESKSKSEARKIQESSQVTSLKPSTPGTVPARETPSSAPKNTPLSKKASTISKKKSNSKLNNKDQGRKVDNKISDPETSEGEIVENVDISKNPTSENTREVTVRKNIPKNDERRTSFMDLTINTHENLSPREGSTVHCPESPTSLKQTQSTFSGKPPHTNLRPEEKSYPVGPKSEQKFKPIPEKQNLSRHDVHMEDVQRPEACVQSGRVEHIRQKQLTLRDRDRESRIAVYPTLQDLLSQDIDLKEWLEITGYHNKPYRDKILSRRRAIAALDAQREKLIAEIEAEERGGIPIQSQPFSSSMLPPPIPISKPGERLGTSSTSTAISGGPYERHNVVASKRSFSQSQDSWLENGPGKIARTDNMNYSSWTKDDLSSDSRRPRSSGHDTASRQVFDHYDDPSRANINSNRESPIFIANERKSPARVIGYENDPYDDDEISETGTRSFEGRRNHRGRNFDSKHRGRGRARGRGEIRDSRDSPEPRSEVSSNLKNANSRPNKTARAASRGSRGNH